MKRILFFLLFISIAFSCEKEYYTTIPNYPVNFELRLGDLDYNSPLSYAVFTTPRLALDKLGYGGILVINGLGEKLPNFFAYDLACPVEAKRNIRVAPDKDNSNLTATCPECGAVFTIATGTGAPQSGTKYYLRSYRVVGSGAQYTVIN